MLVIPAIDLSEARWLRLLARRHGPRQSIRITAEMALRCRRGASGLYIVYSMCHPGRP